MGQNVGPELLLLGKILNNFATLPGKATVLLHGYTYSYAHRKPRKGQKGPCCRPTKQKCKRDNKLRNICKTRSGRTKCGEGCTRLIEALEGLQRKEEAKKKAKKKKKVMISSRSVRPKMEESESFEDYSSESEDYSDEKKEVPRPFAKSRRVPNKQGKKEDNMGFKAKKGQKLSQKQLNMLESASNVRETSTNPLCKETNLFRSFTYFETQNKLIGRFI